MLLIKTPLPVHVSYGEDCVARDFALMAPLGRRCVIVTGARSAKASGALADVFAALRRLGIEYTLFDEVEQNPLVSTCRRAGVLARDFGADFLIGIGGGSPLDAVKGAAVFARHDVPENDIFTLSFSDPLPTVAVGTTAGTGSEVTPYSVLTVPEIKSKKSVKNPSLFPKVAYLDPRYTWTLDFAFTVSTALDTICHAVESCLSKRSSPDSERDALTAISTVWPVLRGLAPERPVSFREREELLYGSTTAGAAIVTTGTCFPHSMGYQPTYSNGVAHGAATAFFLPELLQWHEDGGDERVGEILRAAREDSLEGFIAGINRLNPPPKTLSDAQLDEYAKSIAGAASFGSSRRPYPDDEASVRALYKKVLGAPQT